MSDLQILVTPEPQDRVTQALSVSFTNSADVHFIVETDEVQFLNLGGTEWPTGPGTVTFEASSERLICLSEYWHDILTKNSYWSSNGCRVTIKIAPQYGWALHAFLSFINNRCTNLPQQATLSQISSLCTFLVCTDTVSAMWMVPSAWIRALPSHIKYYWPSDATRQIQHVQILSVASVLNLKDPQQRIIESFYRGSTTAKLGAKQSDNPQQLGYYADAHLACSDLELPLPANLLDNACALRASKLKKIRQFIHSLDCSAPGKRVCTLVKADNDARACDRNSLSVWNDCFVPGVFGCQPGQSTQFVENDGCSLQTIHNWFTHLKQHKSFSGAGAANWDGDVKLDQTPLSNPFPTPWRSHKECFLPEKILAILEPMAGNALWASIRKEPGADVNMQ